jgi:hypothetical protein
MSVGTLGISRTVVRWGVVGVVVAACAGALLVGVGTVQRASAQSTAVDLAGVARFAVLTSGTVAGAGKSSITGDVGGSTVTGLDGRVTGTLSTGGGTAQSLADLGTADDSVASSPVTTALTEVGGTLGPGTYGVSGSIDVPGPLTLDAKGNADATFIIKTDAAFVTSDTTSITLAGGARACNVFWLSGGSATVEGTVVGTVFGRSGVTARSGAKVTGRLLARSGAVRLDGVTVRVPTDCKGAPGPGQAGAGGTGGGAPSPGTDGPRTSGTDGTGSGTEPATEGSTKRNTEATTAPGTDSAAGRGTARHGSGTSGQTGAGTSGGRTGDRGGATSGGTGGRSATTDGGRSGRTPDATDDRTPASDDADGPAAGRRGAAEPDDSSAGAPVVTVPGLDPDSDDGVIGRRVLGVLAHLPSSDDDTDGGAGDGTGGDSI